MKLSDFNEFINETLTDSNKIYDEILVNYDYFKKETKNYPDYNQNPSEAKKVVDEIMDRVKADYPKLPYNLYDEIKDMIHAGIS